MGKSSPDPSNQPGDGNLTIETPNLFIPGVQNSDSEDEDLAHDGYEMLPQDLNDNAQHEEEDSEVITFNCLLIEYTVYYIFFIIFFVQDSSSSEENNEVIIPSSNIPAVSTFDQALRSEVSELWSTAHSSRLPNIEMDCAKEELIRNALANFTLPSSAIPSWAKDIPEEEWKQQLIQQINLKK